MAICAFILLGQLVNYALNPQQLAADQLAQWRWRLQFALGAATGLALTLTALFMPESHLWLTKLKPLVSAPASSQQQQNAAERRQSATRIARSDSDARRDSESKRPDSQVRVSLDSTDAGADPADVDAAPPRSGVAFGLSNTHSVVDVGSLHLRPKPERTERCSALAKGSRSAIETLPRSHTPWCFMQGAGACGASRVRPAADRHQCCRLLCALLLSRSVLGVQCRL